jgi:hypothetical protein
MLLTEREFYQRICANDKSLTELDLSSCLRNSASEVPMLLQALANNTHILKLNLSRNHIESDHIQLLAQMVYLKNLDLSHNSIDNAGLAALTIDSLNALNLSTNRITSQGIASLLSPNALTKLELDHNNIADGGCAGLNRHIGLTHLSLADCGVSDQGAAVLAQHPHLIYLNLALNRLEASGAGAFAHKNVLRTLQSQDKLQQIRKALAIWEAFLKIAGQCIEHFIVLAGCYL